MRHFQLICAILAIAPVMGSYAQPITAKKQQAQADGLALGAASRGSGPLTPQALSNKASAQGETNVWGGNYNGKADPSLTGLSNSSSMIGIGSNARNKSVAGFKQYDGDRGDQANQATYFLDKNPALVPTISPDDPMLDPKNLGVVPDIFASNTSKVCKQTTMSTQLDDKTLYTCSETYTPYVVSCSSEVHINVGQQSTCDIGQQYSVQMNGSSGMASDGCQGGDFMNASWTCSTNDYPTITMSTTRRGDVVVSAVVPTNGSAVTNIYGSCYAKFENNTTCLNGQCNGDYRMILGIMDSTYGPYPAECTDMSYTDDNNYIIEYYTYPNGQQCARPLISTDFVERSFGAASRINATGQFSMSKTVIGSYTSSTCAALEGLAQ